MDVCIAGDFCARERVAEKINQGRYEIFEQIHQMIDENDLNIINLEAPILPPKGNNHKEDKTGPVICQTPKALDAIQYLGFNCVTLANNHFRDYGDEGCKHTLKLIDERKLMRVGGGNNIAEASKVLYYSDPNIHSRIEKKAQLAIINFCENEYSIASKKRPGSAPLNEVACYRQIQEGKMNAENVIVIVHGGIERYRYPTPRMVNLYRWFVEIGADIVINHHQHCYSGYEHYRNGAIFYGLGNFCFDWSAQKNKDWCEGYMVKLSIEKDKPLSGSFSIIPYVQCANEEGVRLMNNLERQQFNIEIEHLNEVISNGAELQKHFENHLIETWPRIRGWLSPYMNRHLLSLCRKGILPIFVTRRKMMLISNLTRCESHREELIEMISLKTRR